MFYDIRKYREAINKIASDIKIHNGKILVTGASGLIGTCLVDVLVEANVSFGSNFEIYALGRNENKLIDRFGNDNKVKFVVQSVTEPIKIKGIDFIVHAASNADPRSYALYPVETILTNVIGSKNILEYCRDNGSKALLTSSFEVYGKLRQDVYKESQSGMIDLNLIRSCYPESKRISELLFKSYADEYGVDSVIVRLPSVYGPTMQENDSKAHAQFIKNALSGNNILLKSQGTQKRTYCYVMDAVSGILKVLFHGKVGEVYNVANGKSISTISELARMIANQVGTEVVFDIPDEIENKGFSKPQNCILDTSKIEGLGWSGNYDLMTGIIDTLSILQESKM
ncbi:NAD-dependent epimerase/dehydratase family protein [Eubacterium sp.]|uniref:NAD-dependent epimerase/dehydratase family protein n=1 Tax=Eubacterium sp. TaxID=142586 RepID=UPI0025E02917|nr:NAD-dependent epimerase/dehydratase family protein [Eubacterium sp.]MCR5629816.1 NAD-dependent epimerase/dehydratase family protein [Eubacterium sp.]